MKKYIFPLLLIIAILAADQLFKIWIKTHMYLGEEIHVAGNWFIIHFTENNGMAFGMELSGPYGKLILTLFRILVVGGIFWYLHKLISGQANRYFVICVSLVVAGAMGNIIDSVFYGQWFHYAPLFHGRVVDMFYFPIIETQIPEWFPIWKGEDFVFFRPVFNIADASISTGVISIFVFQRRFFKKEETAESQDGDAGATPPEVSQTAE